MKRTLITLAALLMAVLLAAPLAAKDKKADVWGPGVPYTTDWDDAIKQVRSSGKMLFIYNGWRDPNI